DVAIIAEWPGVAALEQVANERRTPWLLVEDAGWGGVALGPVFRPGYRGCFVCYVARRRANNGRTCRPVESISGRALDVLETIVATMFVSQARVFSKQVVVAGHGEIAEHVFLPVPYCPCCGASADYDRRISFEELVDSRLGLVHEVRDLPDAMEGVTAALA